MEFIFYLIAAIVLLNFRGVISDISSMAEDELKELKVSSRLSNLKRTSKEMNNFLRINGVSSERKIWDSDNAMDFLENLEMELAKKTAQNTQNSNSNNNQNQGNNNG